MKKHLPKLFRTLSPLLPTLAARAAQSLFISTNKYPRPAKETKVWNSGQTLSFPSGRVARTYGTHGPWVTFVAGWEGRGSQFFAWVDPFVQAGYRVVLWDGPAHGANPETETTMVELGQALQEDFETLGVPLEAVIAHSFGGGSSAWSVLKGLESRHLVLVGSPVSIEGVISRFEARLQLQRKAREKFREKLERKTQVNINSISLINFYPQIAGRTRVTLIHDREDKEVPFAEITDFQKKHPDVNIYATQGLGHRRILLDPKTIHYVLSLFSKKIL